MGEMPMRAYVFSGANVTAHTTDKDGKNLPTDRAPWHLVKQFDTAELSGPGTADILHGLSTNGLHVLKRRISAGPLKPLA
jgi:hypothetical protein